ncbi:MAG: methyl-accepting chemotaxis protein [Oceanospirillum sp.]|nr:methyl-accepting chemotaxis protein [Oceanospirillum sp.]
MNINFSLRQKLILIVAVIIVGFAIMGLYSISVLGTMNDASTEQNQINQASTEISQLQSRLLILEKLKEQPDPQALAQATRSINQLKDNYQAPLSQARDNLADNAARAQLGEILNLMPDYLKTLDDSIGLSLQLEGEQGLIKKLDTTANEVVEKLGILDSFSSTFKEIRNAEKDFLIVSDQAHQQAVMDLIEKLRSDMRAFNFEDMFAEDADRYETAFLAMASVKLKHAEDESKLDGLRQQLNEQIQQATHRLVDVLAEEAQQNVQQTRDSARNSLIIGSLVLVTIAVLIIGSVATSISRNMQRALNALNQIASGDLTTRMAKGSNPSDEFNQLADATNTMCSQIHDLVSHIKTSTHSLKQISDETDHSQQNIQQSSENISQRSTSLVAATEEISVTTEQIAQSGQQVSSATQGAHDSAQDGAQVISQALESLQSVAAAFESTSHSVEQLGEQSKEIDTVIELIQGVAEQTNLLALNAAIEAARAGEAGRGFAVVADEVRTLAEQTVNATASITEKIERIQKGTKEVVEAINQSRSEVENGRQLSEKAETAIRRIEQQTSEAAEQATSIEQAIREVALTTGDMAQNMDSIASEIKNNNQANRQISDNTRATYERAEQLEKLTEAFTV